MASCLAGHQALVSGDWWRSKSCLFTYTTERRPYERVNKSAKINHHNIVKRGEGDFSEKFGENSPNWATQSHKSPHSALHKYICFSDS